MEELRQKLRMIISHASGGHLSDPKDIDRSTNDICVEISRHKNAIWEQAQASARQSPEAVTDELREALEKARGCLKANSYGQRDEVMQMIDAALLKVSPR